MVHATEIAIRPLSPIGAEVTGVDMREEPSDEVKALLRDAWHRHSFLLLRGQDISLEQQMAFARIFGDISSQGENAAKTGGVTYVSNAIPDGQNPYGELTFHIDHSFYPTPLHGILINALQIPNSGGDTMFASAKLAYKMLPDALKARIEDLKAVHCYDFAVARSDKTVARIREADIPPEAPRATHPVVMTDEVTGEKILYISRRHTDRILDIPDEESEALLDELLVYLHKPELIYTHKWTVGDVVLWDNLALQHARNTFDPNQKRHMRRVQIK